MRSSPPSVEDVGELMQHIQSRLPVKEAACTSVLSKSWLHAWSTIPNLRFHVREREYLEVVDSTLKRYFCDNIPIECFELDIDIKNVESASLAENWIRSVATKTCSTLKELSLTVTLSGASLTVPDEILSFGKNITKLTVASTSQQGPVHSIWMKTPINSNSNNNSITKCVSLREVFLIGVRISQEVLDGIFSTCSLLDNIELCLNKQDEGRTIKIKNLARLHDLRIYSQDGDTTDLEISGVPNLQFFKCDLNFGHFPRREPRPFGTYSISLGSSVTELWLGGLITDESSLEMIKSGCPFLERLTLDMACWTLDIFHFTCASLKRLALSGLHPHGLIDVQVYAPKLLDFWFFGYTLPSLSFPISTLVQTTLKLVLKMPLDASFFLKMREALTLSSKCSLYITTNGRQKSDIDLNDLRTRLPFPPANNVQLLEFQTMNVEDGGRSPFLDAFFEICHPNIVSAKPDLTLGVTGNHLFELMLRDVLDKKKKMKTIREWPRYLKHVQILRHFKYWETLRSSHARSFIVGEPIHFKLNWR